MLRRLINWFRGDSEDLAPIAQQERRRANAHAAVHVDTRTDLPSRDEKFSLDPAPDGHIESQGPGKNVFVKKKYIREDTGTYETLKIVDDSLLEEPEEDGIDPYNSGEFDRSKNWDGRFRS